MERSDIINEIIRHNSFTKYLEIGVAFPQGCFDKIKVKHKHSVDPGVEVPEEKAMYTLTSDEFFDSLSKGKLNIPSDYKWDVIFIDGLHTADQVEKDIKNAYKHISEFGYIVMHDCNPPTIYHARENYSDRETFAGWLWNGTTWKAVQKLRQGKVINEPIDVVTVDTDWGCGVLRKGKGAESFDPNYNTFYEYEKFREKRSEILNLINEDQFINWLNNKL